MGDTIRAAAAGLRAVALAARRRALLAAQTMSTTTTTSRSFRGVPLRAAAATVGTTGGRARCCGGDQARAMFAESPWSSGVGDFAARGCAAASASAGVGGGGSSGGSGGESPSPSSSPTLVPDSSPSSSHSEEAVAGGEGSSSASAHEEAQALIDAETERAAAAGIKANLRKDLYMMFTCVCFQMGQLVPLHRGRCDTRAVKGFSRQAYDNGVVIVTCPGCERQHVVADRYGWFGDPGSVEDFLADQADQKVVVGSAKLGVPAGVVGGEVDEDGTLEIDQEQLSAWLAKQAAGAAGAETETETETGEGGGGEGK